MQKRNITIYDVADTAGVSIATVSRTIAKPHVVRPTTRDRVLNAMVALNWQPDATAQALALILAEYRRKGLN